MACPALVRRVDHKERALKGALFWAKGGFAPPVQRGQVAGHLFAGVCQGPRRGARPQREAEGLEQRLRQLEKQRCAGGFLPPSPRFYNRSTVI